MAKKQQQTILKLACADLGSKDCSHVITGKTMQEVKDKVMVHAKQVHPDLLAKMSKQEMDAMMQKADTYLAKQIM